MKREFLVQDGQKLLVSTYCKCGRLITTVGPDPRIAPTRREVSKTNVRTIIETVYVSRLRTPDFATVEFEVQDTDGRTGIHQTTVCKACKTFLTDGVNDIAEVQAYYDDDLLAMSEEAGAGHAGVEVLAGRKVIRVIG